MRTVNIVYRGWVAQSMVRVARQAVAELADRGNFVHIDPVCDGREFVLTIRMSGIGMDDQEYAMLIGCLTALAPCIVDPARCHVTFRDDAAEETSVLYMGDVNSRRHMWLEDLQAKAVGACSELIAEMKVCGLDVEHVARVESSLMNVLGMAERLHDAGWKAHVLTDEAAVHAE